LREWRGGNVTNWILIPVFLVSSAAWASPAQEAVENLTPLKVELRLSAAPDASDGAVSVVLYVLADSHEPTALRAGREVAVPTAGNQYRNVGTNITCRASTSGPGFRLELQIERSSLVEGSDPGRPSFHTFNVNSAVRLRDGESARILGQVESASESLREVEAKLVVMRD
jgi:hypothetical protein